VFESLVGIAARRVGRFLGPVKRGYELWATVARRAVQAVALGADRVAPQGFGEAGCDLLPDIWDELAVERVEVVEVVDDLVDLGLRERSDVTRAGGRWARDVGSVWGGDDRHRVGVAERIRAARVCDALL